PDGVVSKVHQTDNPIYQDSQVPRGLACAEVLEVSPPCLFEACGWSSYWRWLIRSPHRISPLGGRRWVACRSIKPVAAGAATSCRVKTAMSRRTDRIACRFTRWPPTTS